MRYPTATICLAVSLLAPVLAACRAPAASPTTIEDPYGVIEIQPFQDIRVALVSASGDDGIGSEGIELLRGAQLAVEAYGSIKSFDVEIESINVQCSEAGGRSMALIAAADNRIVAVLGPHCSEACAASLPLLDDAGLTAISPACSAPLLTDSAAHNDAFLRTIYNDTVEAETAAQFAYLELGARRAAIIHDGTLDTEPLASAFAAAFGALGGNIADTLTIERGNADWSTILWAILAADVDLIYAPLLADDGVRLAQAQRVSELSEVPLLGGRHFASAWFASQVTSETRIFASAPNPQGSRMEELRQQYEAAFQTPPGSSLVAHSYDATSMLLAAIDQASTLGSNRVLLIGRLALRQALYRTAALPGAASSITCTSLGECTLSSAAILELRAGAWAPAYIP